MQMPLPSQNVAVTPEIQGLLAAGAVVAVGVSGGKDSVACALAVARHLDQIGHTGPRVLIHSDLGRVEWKESLPSCQRLAELIGWELMVVRRAAGDMLARWESRWAANLARYADLSCVRLILPWSTPALRFCTSELKVAVITSALKARFPSHAIINAAGIRRQESSARSKMPVTAPMSKLERQGRPGLSWNPIIEWSIEQVFEEIAAAGLELHEAYTRYGVSRVSCAFCIMSSAGDLMAAAGCADNHDLYRQMVKLECDSTFAFQGARWLADVAPDLLAPDLRARVAVAKAAAAERQIAESEIPPHLLYTKGWPTCMPTLEEAELLARVRRRVAACIDVEIGYTDARSILERYEALMLMGGKGLPSEPAVEEATQMVLF